MPKVKKSAKDDTSSSISHHHMMTQAPHRAIPQVLILGSRGWSPTGIKGEIRGGVVNLSGVAQGKHTLPGERGTERDPLH